MRDVYLCYDPVSSGFIGILPEGPLVILVEVFEALKLVYFEVVLPQPSSESEIAPRLMDPRSGRTVVLCRGTSAYLGRMHLHITWAEYATRNLRCLGGA